MLLAVEVLDEELLELIELVDNALPDPEDVDEDEAVDVAVELAEEDDVPEGGGVPEDEDDDEEELVAEPEEEDDDVEVLLLVALLDEELLGLDDADPVALDVLDDVDVAEGVAVDDEVVRADAELVREPASDDVSVDKDVPLAELEPVAVDVDEAVADDEDELEAEPVPVDE